MFAKLLGYDLKRLFKVLVIFYVLGLVFAVAARLILNIENGATIWFVIGQIVIGGMWAMAVSGVINSVLRSCRIFRVSTYGDESYLVHTLPMKKSTIYLEKFVMGVIVIFVSVVMMVAQVAIAYMPFDEISGILDLLTSTLGTSRGASAVFLFLIFYIEILTVYTVGMAGIVFGHKKGERKMLWSVILGFLFYILTVIFIVGLVAGAGLFDKEILNLFTTAQGNMISANVIKEAAIISLIGYFVATIIMQLIAGKSFCNGVNVE